MESTTPQAKTENEDSIMSAERLMEIVNILLPWGYSQKYPGQFTGLSPYINDSENIITIYDNLPDIKSLLYIELVRAGNGQNERDCFGFYKGIMKVIAPELCSKEVTLYGGNLTVLSFDFTFNEDNRFPVKVEYDPIEG